jgi:1-(5-phosphoribosyl)-5-[(5-phosphoribosylamino)methylideneamino] imidazole-4-carboxamide isomerase/N-(5'phosphoribosyl)anthranilate isomerase
VSGAPPGELLLLPAVDVSGGSAVWPALDAPSNPGPRDPVDLALQLQEHGAAWIHLVDLDAAYARGSNAPLLRRIVAALSVPVQLSGGIRDARSLAAALDSGAARVNLATGALLDLPWVERTIAGHGERIAVGLDVRGHRLTSRGGGEEAGDLFHVLPRLDAAGARRYVVTDIDTDRALSGPNLTLLAEVCTRTDRPVLASGGVSSLADLRDLRQLSADGLEGVILGTALATGAVDLTDALAAAGHQPRGSARPSA